MKHRNTRGISVAGRDRGFAIILTLLVITMLTVLVIGFNAATRTEQMAARNFSYQESAGQMASVALNRAIALLNTNVTNGTLTQPGRSWSPDAKEVLLSSASAGASTVSTNVNIWQAGTGDMTGKPATNYFIATNTAPAFFTVPLIDVRVSNNLIGRYGFWIDDDASRMNLNAAMASSRTNFLPTNSRPFLFSNTTISPRLTAGRGAVFDSLLNPGSSPARTKSWGYFFTPRQLCWLPASTGVSGDKDHAITSVIFNSLMWQVGAGPLNRPSKSYALSSNGLPMAIDAGGASGCLSIYDRRYLNSLDSLTTALDRFVDSNFKGAAYARYFGVSDGLLAKYGRNISRQIVANINDFALPTGAVAPGNKTSVTGAASTMLSPELIPTRVAGYRPFPFLNEIACQTFYATNAAVGGAGTELQVQVWLGFEIANPFDQPWGEGSQIVVDAGDWNYQGSYKGTDGDTVPFKNSAPANDWRLQSLALQTNIPSRSYTNLFLVLSTSTNLPAPLTNAADISVTNDIRLRVVRYLQWRDANETIRDWAFGDDFESWTNSAMSNVAKVSAPNGLVLASDLPSYVSNSWNSATAVGVAKNDPRVKRYPDYAPPSRPWINVQGPKITLGANNSTVDVESGTGLPNVASDRITNKDIMTLFGAESLGNTYPARPLSSAFDLSKIHTGLQWRTLQLRSQDAEEADARPRLAPDWAVLEVFAVANNPAPVQVKLNVNSIPYPAATAGVSVSDLANQGMTRAPAVASLLAGNTNPTAATSASVVAGGTDYPLGIPASAVFPVTNTNSFRAVATNIASLAFTNTWATRRTNTNVFPTNAYSMVSEVLEIDNVSNFSSDEAANEGRARGFYDALAVSSDVFTVYVVGYAMDKNTNVVAESLMRAQVARDPVATNRFRVIMAEPLVFP